MSDADSRAMAAHMMTPLRPATAADSLRAAAIVTELRTAIDKYRNVKRAEADGFKMFAPQIRNQRVYHFTKGLWAIENQFTSIRQSRRRYYIEGTRRGTSSSSVRCTPRPSGFSRRAR